MGRLIQIFTPLEIALRKGEISFEKYLNRTIELIRPQIEEERREKEIAGGPGKERRSG